MTETPVVAHSLTREVLLWGRLIKFSHTIFALPFALSMFVYVASFAPVRGWQLAVILIALVCARTAAMTFNRIIDRDIDALNPRTKNREIPSGLVSVSSAWSLFVIACVGFLLAAWILGWHCFVLSPFVLGVLCFYSWTKRFTSFSHAVLGISLAMAPGGVWYALTGIFAMTPVWMMLGVLFWVVGFDTLYSCQDEHFDRAHRLNSIPSVLGTRKAFLLARSLHVLAIFSLAVFGIVAKLGSGYWVGLSAFAALLFSQHRIIGPNDLSRIDAAFFTRNGIASVVYFLGMLADRWM